VHIEGERRFAAPREDVYRALTDPEEIGEAFAAIERINADGDEWTVTVRPLLPGGFRLKFSVHVEDRREPEHARLRAWGKTLAGRLSVNSSFDLSPDADGTRMRWTADLDAAGLFSGLRRQSLAPAAANQADRALRRLAERLERRTTAR
jgi:carbon monoxide dehydrogenase subunit G